MRKLKILLVLDQYFADTNGLAVSTRRFRGELEKLGHEVRICTSDDLGRADYPVPELRIPLFDGIIKKQGFMYAKPVTAVLREAIGWADIVHLETTFFLSHRAAKLAREMGKPCTGSFHLFPENITSSLHLAWSSFVNNFIYRFFYKTIYRFCSDIHCPSGITADRLREIGYKSRLHVFSNGVTSDFTYDRRQKPEDFGDRFVILSIGRLSHEKRQDLLIEAVRRSRFERRIQLVFAGQGPLKRKYQKLSTKLTNPPVFGVFLNDDLRDIIAVSDLYVHSADVEIEGMSCMEAFACGVVPVISDSPKAATQQFALDCRSVFTAGDADSLRDRIDYWLSHGDERARMEIQYSRHADDYKIAKSAKSMESMLERAVTEHANA